MCKQTPLNITATYAGIPFALTSEAILSANGMSMKATVAWDTGANMTGISFGVIAELGLSSRERRTVYSGRGLAQTWIFKIDIDLGHDIIFRDVTVQSAVLQGSGVDALIGLDIITKGDFHVRSECGQTIMTYDIWNTDD